MRMYSWLGLDSGAGVSRETNIYKRIGSTPSKPSKVPSIENQGRTE